MTSNSSCLDGMEVGKYFKHGKLKSLMEVVEDF